MLRIPTEDELLVSTNLDAAMRVCICQLQWIRSVRLALALRVVTRGPDLEPRHCLTRHLRTILR